MQCDMACLKLKRSEMKESSPRRNELKCLALQVVLNGPLDRPAHRLCCFLPAQAQRL